ncbi:MAG: hypothetical protein ACM3Y9_14750 [Ignavibacteria bacterium]
MTISPSNGCGRHDKARGAKRKLLWLALAVGLAALTALAFVGYRQPDLLLDYVNLRYCG